MRAAGQKDYIPLLGGLITEASPLTFPEGATSSEMNFTVDRDGMLRRRRLGFKNLVDDFVFTGQGACIENTEYWRGPGLLVVIVKNAAPATYIRFHAVDENFTLLQQVQIANAECFTQLAQTTDKLVITLDNGEPPILCSWKKADETITISEVKIHVRDFELVDDDLTTSQRPSSLSENHEYNLLNAGWYPFKKNKRSNNAFEKVSAAFKNYSGAWPSNADVPSIGYILDENGDSVFDPEYVQEADLGNSLAARGHYVYDISDFDRTSRRIAYAIDGSPASTVTEKGVLSLSGIPTYNPDDQSGNTGETGGGVNPYEPIGPARPGDTLP